VYGEDRSDFGAAGQKQVQLHATRQVPELVLACVQRNLRTAGVQAMSRGPLPFKQVPGTKTTEDHLFGFKVVRQVRHKRHTETQFERQIPRSADSA
jgi:hypothetical protein